LPVRELRRAVECPSPDVRLLQLGPGRRYEYEPVLRVRGVEVLMRRELVTQGRKKVDSPYTSPGLSRAHDEMAAHEVYVAPAQSRELAASACGDGPAAGRRHDPRTCPQGPRGACRSTVPLTTAGWRNTATVEPLRLACRTGPKSEVVTDPRVQHSLDTVRASKTHVLADPTDQVGR
jgi:hypothetical protein